MPTEKHDTGRASSASGIEPMRTDRTMSGDDADVAASDVIHSDKTAVSRAIVDEPVVLGPEKARGASKNPMPARVLLNSITLTAIAFAIGYLLVR